MVSHTEHFVTSLLQVYNGFKSITSLVDVVGGIGVCLNMITSQHSHIHGINFDLPHIVANAPEYPRTFVMLRWATKQKLMLAYNERGKECTKKELEDLTMAVGFVRLQVVNTVYMVVVLWS
ncbi:hypothetical protein L7F22_057357 [Adiantum nelumboides]|nr:hypothetical protein [Adiantum nelumboides]